MLSISSIFDSIFFVFLMAGNKFSIVRLFYCVMYANCVVFAEALVIFTIYYEKKRKGMSAIIMSQVILYFVEDHVYNFHK